MNAEQMVAARRARRIRRSAWASHRHPPLTQPNHRATAHRDVVTGVANDGNQVDATRVDRPLITEKIDITGKIEITERIYVAGLDRPLTSVAGSGFARA